jgi:hypothetical protein
MNNEVKLVTVGTDAELFLRDKSTGEIISAEGLIRGSKHRPFKFDKEDKYASTQLDNVLAEFTIRPARTALEFLRGINKSISYIKKTLPKNIEPIIQASANLDDKWLMTEHAQMFGCEPDFNAYTKSINEKPYCENFNLRSCGGHIHAGYEGIEQKFKGDIFNYDVDDQRASIVKVLDLFISVPLVVMEPDSERKLLYGKAGAFRPKPYGVEYRTPSSWYLSSRKTTAWAFKATKNAFAFFKKFGPLSSDLAETVQNIIDNNNKSDAESLIKDSNLQLA